MYSLPVLICATASLEPDEGTLRHLILVSQPRPSESGVDETVLLLTLNAQHGGAEGFTVVQARLPAHGTRRSVVAVAVEEGPVPIAVRARGGDAGGLHRCQVASEE